MTTSGGAKNMPSTSMEARREEKEDPSFDTEIGPDAVAFQHSTSITCTCTKAEVHTRSTTLTHIPVPVRTQERSLMAYGGTEQNTHPSHLRCPSQVLVQHLSEEGAAYAERSRRKIKQQGAWYGLFAPRRMARCGNTQLHGRQPSTTGAAFTARIWT